jgi:hypothetical protein
MDEERKNKEMKDNKKEIKEGKKEEKNNDTKHLEKQVMIVIAIAVIFVIIGLILFFNETESNKFEAAGLIWEKQLHGDKRETTFYVTNIQGYSFDGQPINFNFNMRTDPRKLRNIPVNGEIEILRNKPTYISLDFESGIEQCGSIALVNLGILSARVRLDFQTASVNEEAARENGIPYVTCENSPEDSVFILTTGDKSEINKINSNCYELIVHNCEIIPVVERFQIEILSKLTGKKL